MDGDWVWKGATDGLQVAAQDAPDPLPDQHKVILYSFDGSTAAEGGRDPRHRYGGSPLTDTSPPRAPGVPHCPTDTD
jgi:hypothetical protein